MITEKGRQRRENVERKVENLHKKRKTEKRKCRKKDGKSKTKK